ncbi:unnamed protein product [Staurois parvus]|uniref:Uncharacterized protein n=1 Tax=Staurois parvus TaxID=386267 RepID=A0ABN9FHN8_9NEOB|nr:unnamed protein product [Staurois parvus]
MSRCCQENCNWAFLWHWCSKSFFLTPRPNSSFLFKYHRIELLKNNHTIFFQSSLYFF